MKRARQHKEELMKDAVLYIHGKGGCTAECEHYRPLFPGYEVVGLDYHTFSPWETGTEIHAAVTKLKQMCFLDEWIKRHESMSDSVF